MDELKLKEMKGKAQRAFEEICLEIVDGQGSFTQLLVKAYRAGHDPEKARGAFAALMACVQDAQQIYESAIAQPEPRVSTKSRVTL
jgi:hypothetical protein